ncbi:helix-turn-helix domain-containing protein [uncultured Friedmanniella sp.]|uniref:helix-turn-helix domain-containing protein n=1 Tax=uncultured Friedmanniella sp. TaxID=335381 RepID=UPI0035CCA4F7
MSTWRNAPATVEPVRALVRRPASTAAFDTQRFAVPEQLRPWFAYLWTVDWDRRGAEPLTSTVITYPALHLTAEDGDPGEVRHGVVLPATLLHGSGTHVFRITLSGTGSVVGARFTPGGFAAWTGVDAAALTDRAALVGELLPRFAGTHERTAGLGPGERAAAFTAGLTEHRAAAPADDDLTELVRRMEQDATLVRVEQVATLSGWSARTLQRRFRANLGVSPKWALARFRLQEAALALEQDPGVDLSALAVELGWYDQAHLTNAFRRLLGETPAQYAARARPPS